MIADVADELDDASKEVLAVSSDLQEMVVKQTDLSDRLEHLYEHGYAYACECLQGRNRNAN